MALYGITPAPCSAPALAPDFVPVEAWDRAYLATADKPLTLALLRGDRAERLTVRIRGDGGEADAHFLRRTVKTLLWQKGGDTLLCDDAAAAALLGRQFGPGTFDYAFFSGVYEKPFTVLYTEDIPEAAAHAIPCAVQGGGCRIGFDAGGTDRKAAAVQDGRTVYTEEVLWAPKTHADPAYHYREVRQALLSAAAHLPRVDAVGISTAGVCVGGRVMRSSLFSAVPDPAETRDLYLRVVRDLFGPIPCRVENDGDVSALSGAMTLGRSSLLGIAMGTSQAGGFVTEGGGLTGWLNELAFLPVDDDPAAPVDPWSGDRGCGASYFSQDGVIRLARRAGLRWDETQPLAHQLKAIQAMAEAGDKNALAVFATIGQCLGHTLPLYHRLYGCRHVLLQGRVVSGVGGDTLLDRCRRVLAEEYPSLPLTLVLPDEASRRTGQAVAAAALPSLH
ncbi:MAG: ROK family protein [Oscillospiraceae bacterium]|nr:ROK family protein [Oscillospiraceae bacterium]MBR0211429.1 ROK family protein [Oscillospiraceae bacterium]